jgi:NAD(P)-dependent dehydrogenase (short-subunit alcohol dehydrogenase family)
VMPEAASLARKSTASATSRVSIRRPSGVWASIMGLVGGALYPNPAYHASKGALVNWTRALAVEWAARGVRVNAVAPAFVRTPFTDRLLSDPKMVEAIEAQTPLGRLIETREVADAVLFLASDAASGITGVTLPVDGGWTAR